MNKKTKQSETRAGASCLCQGAGPALSDFLRQFGPPEEARKHFDAARLEVLKGLRALIDARIEQVSKSRNKGEKIEVV